MLVAQTIAFGQTTTAPNPPGSPLSEAVPESPLTVDAPKPAEPTVVEPFSDPASDRVPSYESGLPEAPAGIYGSESDLPGPEDFITAPEYEVFSVSEDGAGPVAPFYSMPTHRYTGWYRPRGVERDTFVRCQPQPFRPRGFGNLFARTPSNRRMGYKPYKLKDWSTDYGPAYYENAPDQRCENCDHDAKKARIRGMLGGGCNSCDGSGCKLCGGLFDKLAFGKKSCGTGSCGASKLGFGKTLFGGGNSGCQTCGGSGGQMKVFSIASRDGGGACQSCNAGTAVPAGSACSSCGSGNAVYSSGDAVYSSGNGAATGHSYGN